MANYGILPLSLSILYAFFKYWETICWVLKNEPLTAIDERIPFGELAYFPLGLDEEIKLALEPTKGFDVGAGQGKDRDATVNGGVVGLLIDTRGRPLDIRSDMPDRIAKIEKWNKFHDQVIAHKDDLGIATRRV